MTDLVDQSFLCILSEASQEMVVDTNQCLSFENKNAFRQEYTNDVLDDSFSYDSLIDVGEFATKLLRKWTT